MSRNAVKVKKPIYKKWWFWLIVVVVLVGLFYPTDDTDTPVLSNTTPTESTTEPTESVGTEAEKPQEETPEEDDIWTKAGMYKVGEEIPAGEYYIETTKSSCYYARTSDSTGALESIIENDNISTFTFVTLKDGEYFEITNAKFTPSSNIEPITSRGEGMYRVGIDLPAGEYKVKSSDTGYYAVLSSTDGSGFGNIVTNDNFDGEKYITVADGQYLKITRAEII